MAGKRAARGRAAARDGLDQGRVRLPALIVKIWQVSCQIAVDRRCCNRSEPLNLHNIRIFGPPIIVLCYIPLRISDN